MKKLFKHPLLIIAIAVVIWLLYSMYYHSATSSSTPHAPTHSPIVPNSSISASEDSRGFA